VFKPKLGLEHTPQNQHGTALIGGMAGLFVVGFLNGSITSGTGLFLTIWLIRYFGLDYTVRWPTPDPLRLDLERHRRAGARMIGTVAWDWMPALLAGSILGVTRQHLAIRKGNLWIKRSFEIVTILIGLKLILG